MQVSKDKSGQLMIEWHQGNNAWKRAWVQDRSGTDKDWAGTGRYINVVRTLGQDKGPAGNATDFPIYSDLPSEQVLIAFVVGICAVTGCKLD